MTQLAGHGYCEGCSVCVVPDGATLAGGRYIANADGVPVPVEPEPPRLRLVRGTE